MMIKILSDASTLGIFCFKKKRNPKSVMTLARNIYSIRMARMGYTFFYIHESSYTSVPFFHLYRYIGKLNYQNVQFKRIIQNFHAYEHYCIVWVYNNISTVLVSNTGYL